MKDDPLKTCPKCGKKIHRLINGGSGIIFKGSGFYTTDKGGKSADAPKTAKTGGAESTPCASCAKSDVCPKAANS